MSDIKPCAWRSEVRWTDQSRDGGKWRKYADYGTLRAAETSHQRFANPGDIESRIVPLYPAAALDAARAEARREALEEAAELCLAMHCDENLRSAPKAGECCDAILSIIVREDRDATRALDTRKHEVPTDPRKVHGQE